MKSGGRNDIMRPLRVSAGIGLAEALPDSAIGPVPGGGTCVQTLTSPRKSLSLSNACGEMVLNEGQR